MNWKIIDSLASPDTGSFFSVAQTARNLKLILWCKGDYFLRQGSTLTTAAHNLLVDGRLQNIMIIHASPYNPQIWQNLVRKTHCPGNTKDVLTRCPEETTCLFKLCPYGLKKYTPQAGQPDNANERGV